MENTIVKDFENLNVFAAHPEHLRMDELVQDLSMALEETTRVGRSGGSQPEGANISVHQRRFVKKRRGTRRSSSNNVYWKRGTISEASESSVEEQSARHCTSNNVIHSDSDDLAARNRIPKLTLVNSVPPVESDSFTENLSPMRPQRRRRKYKTMTVDSSPQTDPIPSDVDSNCGDKYLNRRSKEGSPSSAMERQSMSGPRSSSSTSNLPHSIAAGKRKRASKGRAEVLYSYSHGEMNHNMEVASVSQ